MNDPYFREWTDDPGCRKTRWTSFTEQMFNTLKVNEGTEFFLVPLELSAAVRGLSDSVSQPEAASLSLSLTESEIHWHGPS